METPLGPTSRSKTEPGRQGDAGRLLAILTGAVKKVSLVQIIIENAKQIVPVQCEAVVTPVRQVVAVSIG